MSENGHNGANGAGNGSALPTLAKADFQSDQETRWCPGAATTRSSPASRP